MALVFVVDDSKFMRSQIIKMIKNEGYQIVEAANGRACLALLETHKPDCIITDMLMPEMDGIELLQNLKDRRSDIPILVITADIQEGTRKTCLDLGARAILNKPPKENELQETLKQILVK